jgi:dihydrofolate reductase
MGKLIYSITTSVDGFISDKNGSIEWTNPTEEVLACFNDMLHNVDTFLFGRRMYETMAVWDTIPTDGASKGMNDFAKIWRAAKKIVYSTTLSDVTTANTTVESVFRPEAVQKLISESDKDFNIGGPHLAAEAIKTGIVDEYHQLIAPIMLGSGTYWLPKNVETKLTLINLQKFDNGSVHLHYNKV